MVKILQSGDYLQEILCCFRFSFSLPSLIINILYFGRHQAGIMVVFMLVVFSSLIGLVAAKPESQVMIVFLFFSLVLGAIINLTLVRFAPGVPYTVVVFAVGAIISFVFDAFPNNDPLKQSEVLWNGFEPELLLYIFLPVLLFGEAMSLNFYHVKGAVVPAAVLAGPGVLFGTFLMACVAKIMLPYDWHWNLCFIFGAIMSATDPVGTNFFACVDIIYVIYSNCRCSYCVCSRRRAVEVRGCIEQPHIHDHRRISYERWHRAGALWVVHHAD